MHLLDRYRAVRKASEEICRPLQKEDYVVQPIVDVSPPKWHLGHTTWFWEAFLLIPHYPGYDPCNPDYNFVFNSYYETIGARVVRTDRGNLSRPSVDEICNYRKYVDEAMEKLIAAGPGPHVVQIIVLGLNHEQQHQELLLTDIKYILGHNPLFPVYSPKDPTATTPRVQKPGFLSIPAGLYDIGHAPKPTAPGVKPTAPGVNPSSASVNPSSYANLSSLADHDDFCFDNELAQHKVYLEDYRISDALITNDEWLAFMEDGGYRNFIWWHAEGWDWVKNNAASAPLYWHPINNQWHQFTLSGLQKIDGRQPVCHISYYEAAAFAAWKGARLPTEQEWEAASHLFEWGQRWEWTESAYLPYPGFKKAAGAIGEYNGKFMVNQMVLRGASAATPPGHSRKTYRNFFHPHLRWQFTGIRLASSTMI